MRPLIESLDAESEEGVEDAWMAEVERRMAVAWRRRRCRSTTSPRVRYRIRRDAGTAPRSSAGRARQPP
ncbi:MAG: addiction module protein [Candidatus Rokubacteria bacterium]|nr:addiction module protein [Candidatus Rokubacteria bacterium]